VRLDFFKRKIWPRISGNELQTKFLIFTSNPFEFVKVKSHLQKVNADADFISEHTPKNKTQSRIARFNNGQYRILLLSERAYYF
jgi:superfamily II DNA/RNA helicase